MAGPRRRRRARAGGGDALRVVLRGGESGPGCRARRRAATSSRAAAHAGRIGFSDPGWRRARRQLWGTERAGESRGETELRRGEELKGRNNFVFFSHVKLDQICDKRSF